jgi:GH24 family phage-related lysozyme (muramidase)
MVDKGGGLVIGYGHQSIAGPPIVTEEMVISEPEARAILMNDLASFSKMLDHYIKGIELNDYQYGACLSLVYNRGPGTFRDSEVLSHIKNTSYKWHMVEAARAFVVRGDDKWPKLNHAWDDKLKTHREYLGLTARRITEAALFLTKV